MARQRVEEDGGRRRRPARTPEARELELASAAYDLAEEQIRGGTASSQVITHFLKMGSTREQLEQQRIQHEVELMEVKKDALARADRVEELMVHAIDAMRSYTGFSDPADEV